MLPLLRLLAITIFTIVCAGVGANHGGSSTATTAATEAHRALTASGATVAPKTTHQLRDHDGRHRPLDVAEADLDDDDTDDDTDDSRSDDAHHHLVAVDDIRLLHAPSRSFAGAVHLDTSRFVIGPGLPRGPPTRA